MRELPSIEASRTCFQSRCGILCHPQTPDRHPLYQSNIETGHRHNFPCGFLKREFLLVPLEKVNIEVFSQPVSSFISLFALKFLELLQT